EGSISALHLKAESQQQPVLQAIVEAFNKYMLFDRCLIFDATVEIAQKLKHADERFHIAASVSHEYDIERYNVVVGGTLYSVEEVIQHTDVFDWVWLDEWDLTDREGGEKTLVNKDVCDRLREEGFQIGLVTPE